VLDGRKGMGRVKSVLVKKVAEKLMADHPERFTEDFESNKRVVDEMVIVYSKKLRNLIAGHVTRVKRQGKVFTPPPSREEI